MVVLLDKTKAAPRHPEKVHRPDNEIQRKPSWIRVKAPGSPGYSDTHKIIREHGLVTVCEEAGCPNVGECWEKRHATMMIMGEICTRACAFCNVRTGMPLPLDPKEPENVADAVEKLGLLHVVITSVDRDDLEDGGAQHFAEVIAAIRARTPKTTIEILTPDFLRKPGALEVVVAAKPDVFNHNLETVPSNYLTIRPGARYFHSIRLLQRVKEIDPTMFTKSGIMVGLGEERNEVLATDGRSEVRRCRFPDHRTISAADQEARQGRAFRAARGVCFLCDHRQDEGLPCGLVLAADPLVAPCRRGFRQAQGRAAGKAGQIGTGQMPKLSFERHVRHTPDEMLSLVDDVRSYPGFVPNCIDMVVRDRPDEGSKKTVPCHHDGQPRAVHQGLYQRGQNRPGRGHDHDRCH